MKYRALLEKLQSLSEKELDKEIAFYNSRVETLTSFSCSETNVEEADWLIDFYGTASEIPKLLLKDFT